MSGFVDVLQEFGRGTASSSRCDLMENLLQKGCSQRFIEYPTSTLSKQQDKPLSGTGSGAGSDATQISPQKLEINLRPACGVRPYQLWKGHSEATLWLIPGASIAAVVCADAPGRQNKLIPGASITLQPLTPDRRISTSPYERKRKWMERQMDLISLL
ncbi:UNVERIFIED_CONTAM: hypothetical protein FKN15_000493 [Acipenser sinensis]